MDLESLFALENFFENFSIFFKNKGKNGQNFRFFQQKNFQISRIYDKKNRKFTQTLVKTTFVQKSKKFLKSTFFRKNFEIFFSIFSIFSNFSTFKNRKFRKIFKNFKKNFFFKNFKNFSKFSIFSIFSNFFKNFSKFSIFDFFDFFQNFSEKSILMSSDLENLIFSIFAFFSSAFRQKYKWKSAENFSTAFWGIEEQIVKILSKMEKGLSRKSPRKTSNFHLDFKLKIWSL